MPLGIDFKEISDGTSSTIMLVEVADDLAAIWTKPEDFEPNLEEPWKGLVNKGALGANVVLADGSIRFIPQSWDQAELMKALIINDGEPVNWPGDKGREKIRRRMR